MNTTMAIANSITGLCYLFIAYKLFKYQEQRQGLLQESVVFGAFILICGVHHLAMIVRHPHLNAFQVSLDISLTMISLMAAIVVQARPGGGRVTETGHPTKGTQ